MSRRHMVGRIPVNNQIIYNMQTVLNLLPNLNVDELVRAMMMKTNDMHLVIYLSSLIRCVVALHDLVNNKIQFTETEDGLVKKEESKEKETKEEEKKAEKKSAAA